MTSLRRRLDRLEQSSRQVDNRHDGGFVYVLGEGAQQMPLPAGIKRPVKFKVLGGPWADRAALD